MKCDHKFDRVIVEGDRQPDGWNYPRCAGCGHRMPYAGSRPTATRKLVIRHPSYLLVELAGRYEAKRTGRHHKSPARL